MYPTQKEIEVAIAKDYREMSEACRRLEARLDLYIEWRNHKGGQEAYCRACDHLFEIKRGLGALHDALERM